MPNTPIFFEPAKFGRRVLLTGAGWTKNWGGYLAFEFSNRLMSKPEIRSNHRLLNLIQHNNFEVALEKAWCYTEDHLEDNDAMDGPILQDAIKEVFADMQAEITRRPNHSINIYRVQKFLSRFAPSNVPTGFLFSLNQDFWYESNYYNFYQGSRPQTSGVKHGQDYFTPNALVHEDGFIRRVDFKEKDRLKLDGYNNVVKLHGSANWLDSGGEQMMIVGGNKMDAIHGEQLLLDYYELFEEVLCLGKVRLMVIGYGWGDLHINEVISKAVAHHELTIWNWSAEKTFGELQPILSRNKAGNVVHSLHGIIDRPFSEVFHKDDTELSPWDQRIEEFFAH